jgi:hypothetical protein
MTLQLHRITAIILALFLASHLAVHLFALAGPDAHDAALTAIQWTYRHPVVEPLLLMALLFQIGLGLRLLWRRWREPGKSRWAKLQLASGLYLTYFIINHSSAALITRSVGQLDTNFWWVSGPLLHPLLSWWFYPYYAFAVMAVTAHAGAALHFRGYDQPAKWVAASGVPVVLAYWLSFGGWLFATPARADYRAFYDVLLAMIGLS